jgi:hypothetical protein
MYRINASGAQAMTIATASLSATQRIVVQTTTLDKRAIVAKAKKLDIPISELMRRGAFAYQSEESDDALNALADAAKSAADRSAAAIDDALDFIALSNKRIATMEAKAVKSAASLTPKLAQKATARTARVAQRKAA